MDKFWIILLTTACYTLSGCVSLKAYQKQQLNHSQMDLSPGSSEKFDTNVETYREGGAGGNGGKTGGGCGCY